MVIPLCGGKRIWPRKPGRPPLPLLGEGSVPLNFIPSVGTLTPSVDSHPTPSFPVDGINYEIHLYGFFSEIAFELGAGLESAPI